MNRPSNILSLSLAISLTITALNIITTQAGGSPTPSPCPPTPSPTPAAAPSPGPGCMSGLLNLSACLTYVKVGSNVTVPDKGCCPSLSSLADRGPVCLCQLLTGGGEAFGVKIDGEKVLMLPTACRVAETPPVTLCSAVGIPVPGPMGPAGPSLAPTIEGPELPVSTPMMPFDIPAAAPANSNSGSGGTTNLRTLVGVFIAIIIF